jgi:hypothetical protein
MWQRIQTLFLTVLIIALLISLVQPIWLYHVDGKVVTLTPFYFSEDGSAFLYMPYSVTAILIIAVVTIAFTSIRKYKDRVLQMKLGAFNSLLLVGIIATSVYFSLQLMKKFEGGEYGLGLFLPAGAVVCNMLANFFIRRDERLVRNSERLR